MSWFLMALRKYAKFSGRSQRAEYWFFFLFQALFLIGLAFLDGMLGFFDESEDVGLFSGIFAIAMIIPSFSVNVRRLHDTGRSGWWLLASLVPVLGSLVLVVFALQDSQPGGNAYGPDPKAPA